MIFLGPLFRREDELLIAERTKNGRPQNQANTFQWNCIDGLIENGEKVSIVNCLPVGTFPENYSAVALKSKNWEYRGKRNIEIGSLNLPIVKQITRALKTRSVIKRQAENTILIYSTYLPYLWAVRKLGEEYNVILIVADIPEFYDYSKATSKLRKGLRKYYNSFVYKCLDRIDGFVLLTEQMKEPLKIGGRPYVIIEGICSVTDSYTKTKHHEDNEKSIVYTGSLNECFGIATLVEAFKLTDDETYRLKLCGSGDYEDEIRRAAKADNRIEFLGVVSRDTALELQQQAAVLVNPRSNDGDYTKYSFPSKMMEYLQSAVPTVAYKLDGIPDEYDEYINYVENNSIEAMKTIIDNICMDEKGVYREKANQAKVFVESEKNNIKQTKKIQKLIEMLSSNA